MLRLPGLSSGSRRWCLPLADATATALVTGILDATGDPVAQLAEALQFDPSAALWCHCRAASRGQVALTSLGRLAGWLWTNRRRELVWTEADAAAGDAGPLEACVELATAAVETSVLAAASAAAEPALAAGTNIDEVRLLGLLHAAESWLGLAAPGAGATEVSQPASGARPWPATGWLADALASLATGAATAPPAAAVQRALEIRAAQTEPPPQVSFDAAGRQARAAGVRRRWSADGACGLAPFLPALVQKLARRAELEQRFDERLEHEKLEALAELAAGAGHEINNPLAVIAGRAQLLLREERDVERRRELAVINRQAMRVHEMIADMMLFARPPRPQLDDCDLARLCQTVVAELRPQAAERHIELMSCVGQEPPLLVRADAVQLAVAVRAICENAISALGGGGRVELALRRVPAANGEAEQAELTIRDDGPGIAPEVRRHLFDPFYSGREAGRGLGMGLAKCWRIVTNHGGRIEVESEPGRGAVFRLRLPLG